MIEAEHLENYYKEHKLAMQGVAYRPFVKQCNAYREEAPEVDHYYIMQEVASMLIKKARTAVNNVTIQQAVSSKLGGLVKIQGYLRRVSPIAENSWGKPYRFITLCDKTGQIDAILNGALVELSDSNIQQGDSIEVCGQVTGDRSKPARITGVTGLSKIAPVKDYLQTISVSDIGIRGSGDIFVKVLKIVKEPHPRPNTAVVEDPKGIGAIKYWASNFSLVEGKYYEISNVVRDGNGTHLITTGKTTVTPSEKSFYTYVSDIYLTSMQGVTPGGIYNVEAKLSMAVEFTYNGKNGETTATRYVFTTPDDQAEVTMVDWRHELTKTGAFSKGPNRRYRFRYVRVSQYNTKWNLNFETFSEVSSQ